jgi:uncharacterized protein (TIGR02996 family)
MAADEAHFLEAIASDPTDDTRQVYADWLEERGDPRAEYVRLEAALHKLGPAARHPSRHKDPVRRDELAESFDDAWLDIVRRKTPKVEPPVRARVYGILLAGIVILCGYELRTEDFFWRFFNGP